MLTSLSIKTCVLHQFTGAGKKWRIVSEYSDQVVCNACKNNRDGIHCELCLPYYFPTYGPENLRCKSKCNSTTTCTGHGYCQYDSGTCKCNNGWYGQNCEQCDGITLCSKHVADSVHTGLDLLYLVEAPNVALHNCNSSPARTDSTAFSL